jgi:hypothetical protein
MVISFGTISIPEWFKKWIEEQRFLGGGFQEAEEVLAKTLKDFRDHPVVNNDLACLFC